MLKYSVLLTAMAIAGCAAPAAQGPAGAKLAKNDPNRQICRYYRPTGSIMPGKSVCHTEAQWQAIDNQNQQQAESELGTSGRQNGPTGGMGN